MKKNYLFRRWTFMIMIALCFGNYQLMNGQCVTVDEGDFADLCVEANEAAPNSGPQTSNTLDVWDLANNAPGTDGTPDIQLTLEAVVNNPNANGTCDDGDFAMGGCIGGAGALGGSSDYGNTQSDDCVCESGYICVTIDFINGFSAEAGTFDLAVTSSNGSTEGVEATFGYVTAGTDALGAPLAGLPTVTLANLATYCNAEYLAGPVSAHVGATGPGTFAVDEPTGIPNNCAISSQNGEDTGSGDNPGDNTNIQAESPNVGLNATDVITQFKLVYYVSNASGTDCDGDGDTSVGTNPSSSWKNIEICPPPPPCGFTGEVALVEECGVFDIELTNVMAQDAGQTSFDIEYSNDNGLTWVVASSANAIPAASPIALDVNLPADGATAYLIRLVDGANATCNDELGPLTAPKGNTPLIVTYPAN